MAGVNKIGGMKAFLVVSLGQVVSLLGSSLTTFALGVWVYQRTGSVTKFALIAFFSSLPGLTLSPLAGALVDRWDRRRTMVLSDAMAAVTSAVLLVLLWDESRNLLAMWHIYALMVIASCANALQVPAFDAATSLLVAKEQYGRASGLTQMGLAIAQIASPFLGALMLLSVKMRGILIVDLATFGFSVLTLLAVTFREPERTAQAAEHRSLWQDSALGWTYIRERPGLLTLLLLMAVVNFNVGLLQSLLPPLILGFASATALGSVLSLAGVGMLAGTLLMGVWGGPRRRINGIFAGFVIEGLILFLGGLRPSVALVGTAAFVYLFVAPMISGCSQAIWQSKVSPALQGRVFAVRRMVAQLSLPAAYFLAGPLADHVFEPMLAPGGALAGSVGALIGTGKGRGIGFLFILLGALVLVTLPVFSAYRPLRKVEEELPDAVPDAAPAGVPPAAAQGGV